MIITDATNLPRLMKCQGSRLMKAIVPQETNQEARDEGNAADWAAVQLFNGATVADGQRAPNGYVVTAEMLDHVRSYLSALDCGEVQAVTSFAGANFQINGRCDHWKWQPANLTLTVDDLKYGHRIVEPDENWTLLAHAIGLCIEHQLTPNTVSLRIHQPRPYHPDGKVREWNISYEQLLSYYAEIDATLNNPSDMLQTGEHCHHCAAAPTCPAYRMAAMNAIDVSTLAFNDELPNEVIEHELDTLLVAKARLDERLDALREYATHKLRGGEVIGNYALEQQKANTRWKAGISPEALTLASGINCMKPGAITPAEFLRRGGAQTTYDALTERPIIGTKLVRVDQDKRARRMLKKGNA